VMNASDDSCWRDMDMAFVGTTAPRLVSRFCPEGVTAFALRSTGADGTSLDLSTSAINATLGADVVVFVEASGALKSSHGDGTSAVTLATDALDHVLSRDGSTVFYQTSDGALGVSPTATSSPRVVVLPGGVQRLGAVSPDNRYALYASAIQDRGPGQLDVY